MYNCNLFQMKFASDSYAFQIVLTQNYQDFCIWFHQNSHQLFSTVLQCFWQRLPTFESNMICTVIPATLPHFSYTGFHIVFVPRPHPISCDARLCWAWEWCYMHHTPHLTHTHTLITPTHPSRQSRAHTLWDHKQCFWLDATRSCTINFRPVLQTREKAMLRIWPGFR